MRASPSCPLRRQDSYSCTGYERRALVPVLWKHPWTRGASACAAGTMSKHLPAKTTSSVPGSPELVRRTPHYAPTNVGPHFTAHRSQLTYQLKHTPHLRNHSAQRTRNCQASRRQAVHVRKSLRCAFFGTKTSSPRPRASRRCTSASPLKDAHCRNIRLLICRSHRTVTPKVGDRKKNSISVEWLHSKMYSPLPATQKL